MRKYIAALCILTGLAGVKNAAAQEHSCAAHVISERSLQDPAIRERRTAYMNAAAQWLTRNNVQRNSQNPVIVPVVFHIMHDNGEENISKAQILDQLRIMNEDFRRQNADTVNTPAPFKTIAADCMIEFRLAQIAPDGSCTDGIVRVQTNLTNNATDDVKDLSSWDNDRYMNIWVVKSIYNFVGANGMILGYAYYPGTAPPGYDGLIIRADYTGSIEYADAQVGRTATHEIGHYLDLIHIWGDSNCGDDQVSDTPPAVDPNFGCPTFPHVRPACNPSPDGEMFMNYMDYANDVCMNAFTYGQKTRMEAVFANFRSNLVSPANHTSTGIFNTPVACQLVPDFRANRLVICEGDSVKFTDQSWNGTATSRTWNISGGVVAPSSDSIIWIRFNTAGTYDITLDVANAAGLVSKNKNGYIIVKPATAQFTGLYSENFDNNFNLPSSGIDQIAAVNSFIPTTLSSFSFPMSFYKPSAIAAADTFNVVVLPECDFSLYNNLKLNFKIAGRLTDALSQALLRVEVSNNCGVTWQPRFNHRGTALFSAVGSASFIPSLTDWKQESVSISSLSGSTKGLIRFILHSDKLSEFYIDDIQVSGVSTGLNEVKEADFVTVFPNPSNGNFTLQFKPGHTGEEICLYDTPGKLIEKRKISDNEMQMQLNLPAGMYYLKINDSYKKIIVR